MAAIKVITPPKSVAFSAIELLEDIIVTPGVLLPTIVDASGSALGYTLKPIPAERENQFLQIQKTKKKVGRPVKLPSAFSRPVGRPVDVAADDIQYVATLPRVAQAPLRPVSPPLSRSPGPTMMGPNISISKTREPRVVDANKARLLVSQGLSMTPSTANKQHSPLVNKQKAMIQPQPNQSLEARKRNQQRPVPFPQQQARMPKQRVAPYPSSTPCTIGTPEDILRSLSAPSAPHGGSHMKPPTGRTPPSSRGIPPLARGIPPSSRGRPYPARGLPPPQRNLVSRGQKMMPTGRTLTPNHARQNPNHPRAWSGQNQSRGGLNLPRPVSRHPGVPIGAKPNLPQGVTIAASKF